NISNTFSLREVCNRLIKELNNSDQTASIIRISVEIEVPDHLEGNAEEFESRLKAVCTWLARNIINGIINVSIQLIAEQAQRVSLVIAISACHSQGNLERATAHPRRANDELLSTVSSGLKGLRIPSSLNLRCSVDDGAIHVRYREIFVCRRDMT